MAALEVGYVWSAGSWREQRAPVVNMFETFRLKGALVLGLKEDQVRMRVGRVSSHRIGHEGVHGTIRRHLVLDQFVQVVVVVELFPGRRGNAMRP